MTTPTPHGAPELPELALARLFHAAYERLAPQFGYTTRPETREFDPESPNGKLMTAVCAAIQQAAGAVPEGMTELLQSCRGSVKADLARYEQMILSCNYTETRAVYQVEADRLRALLDSIDELVGREAGKEGSSNHLVPCAGGGVTQPLTVSVCYFEEGDDPFVFQCNGLVTASVLADIDKDLQDNRDTLFPDGPGDYEFSVTRYHGQYGEYGRCELAPGWEFDQISFTPLAMHPDDRPVTVRGHKFLVINLPENFFDDKQAPRPNEAASQINPGSAPREDGHG